MLRLRTTRRSLLSSFGIRRLASSSGYDGSSELDLPTPLHNTGIFRFTESKLRRKIGETNYQDFVDAERDGKPVERSLRETLADELSDWAMHKGATNYTHWCFPMLANTPLTRRRTLLNVDQPCQSLVPGEMDSNKLFAQHTDALRLESGGLRGVGRSGAYSAWDTTSSPFVYQDTLFVPAVLVTHDGHPLDHKTTLLRAQEALDEQATRLLGLVGYAREDGVVSNVGWTRELVFVDGDSAEERPDVVACGRAVLGGEAVVGATRHSTEEQILREAREELLSLGVPFYTSDSLGNGRYAVSSIFGRGNVAADQYRLFAKVVEDMASQHGVCVLWHDTPVEGMDGSGVQLDWSVNMDDGDHTNLMERGHTEEEQTRYMAMLAAVCYAADVHGDLLGLACGSEVVSLHVGDGLLDKMREVVEGGELHGLVTDEQVETVDVADCVMPFRPHVEDSHGTSPLQVCGNRLKLRSEIAHNDLNLPLTLLNVAVADGMAQLSSLMEKEQLSVRDAVAKVFREHGVDKAVFHGDDTEEEWVEVAAKRGLWVMSSESDLLQQLTSTKNTEVFDRLAVSDADQEQDRSLLQAWRDMALKSMADEGRREAGVMLEMLQGVLPVAGMDYSDVASCPPLQSLAEHRGTALQRLSDTTLTLQRRLKDMPHRGVVKTAKYTEDRLRPAMEAAREAHDHVLGHLRAELYPFPTNARLLTTRQSAAEPDHQDPLRWSNEEPEDSEQDEPDL